MIRKHPFIYTIVALDRLSACKYYQAFILASLETNALNIPNMNFMRSILTLNLYVVGPLIFEFELHVRLYSTNVVYAYAFGHALCLSTSGLYLYVALSGTNQ